MFSISASVGRNGSNRHDDVVQVQELLRHAGMDPGPVDGIAGRHTITAITGFQHRFLTRPDGRVDPGGQTIAQLNSARVVAAAPRAPLASRRKVPPARVPAARSRPRHAASRKASSIDWSGDSRDWSDEKKLESLEPDFRVKVKAVLQDLKTQGFPTRIVYAWRSMARQRQLRAAGNSKLLFSFHNAQTPQGLPNALAVDVIDTRYGYGDRASREAVHGATVFFDALGATGKRHGLVWGGDWKNFKDVSHLQGRQNGELKHVKKESGL